jgi:hypothetical protein
MSRDYRQKPGQSISFTTVAQYSSRDGMRDGMRDDAGLLPMAATPVSGIGRGLRKSQQRETSGT